MNTRKMFARTVAGAAMAVMASTASAEWNDAHWFIGQGHKGDSVVEIVNMNKLSCRMYAFDRSSIRIPSSLCSQTVGIRFPRMPARMPPAALPIR